MDLKWLMRGGFPNEETDRLKNANSYVYNQVKYAISFKVEYHKEWNVMSDLLNSQINKRLKLPPHYTLVVANDLFKNYETLASQMNLDDLPFELNSLYGQNKDIVPVYETMIASEDKRINGAELRRKVYKSGLKNQIAWLYMYASSKKMNEAYNVKWKNEIKAEVIDASKIHFDPNASEQDLSDCEYIILEERTNYNKLSAEFGNDRLKMLGIEPNSQDYESAERNRDDSFVDSDQNQMTKFTYFFREPKDNGEFDYYYVPMVQQKLIGEPIKCKPNRYPFICYSRIKIYDEQLIGTNELYLTKQDYISKVKVNTALATNAVFESGQQKIINAQNVDANAVKNLMYNPFAVIPIMNTSDVRNQVASLEKREAPQSAYVVPNKIEESTDSVVGNNEISDGGTASLQSGSAVSSAIAQANIRHVSKTETLKTFMREYAILLTDFMMYFYNIPMVHTVAKSKAGDSFNEVFNRSQQETNALPQNEQNEDSKITENVKASLKKHKIKFKEDNNNIYVIAKMSDMKNMRHSISINADKFAKMNEQDTARALETLYAMDTQDPTGTRILTKEKFVELNPAFKGIKNEILNAYELRKNKTERNRVTFISQYVSAITQRLSQQAQQQGMDPSSVINHQQIASQALQMWMQLPEDMKSDGSMSVEEAASVQNNATKKGIDNRVRKW